jgi:hypothetical protein
MFSEQVTHMVLFSAANVPLGQVEQRVSSAADTVPLGQTAHRCERLEVDKKSKSRRWLLEMLRCFKFTNCPGEHREVTLMLRGSPTRAKGFSPVLDATKEITVKVLDFAHLTSTIANGRYGMEPFLGLKVTFIEGAITLALVSAADNTMVVDPSTS